MKKIISLIILLFLFNLSYATLSLTVSTDSSVRIGQTLGVRINVSATGSDSASGLSCSVFTTQNNLNMIDLFTYDSILNEPAGLKTNAGGYAFLNIPITAKYPVDTSFKAYAYCGSANGYSNFTVLSFTPTDQVANFLISLKESAFGWVILILIILFAVALGKMIWSMKKL